ncbi:hypothetical protein F3J11_00205 [Burkholderia sp. Cy-647]|nr:hypothetical protein [Burkholderia sp. Tr-860]NIF61149.1 hypothetical protein [Burkholderia sp. Cy-647]NIF93978.1 hypothetical protein [Burkholderia sp. Ax-1720]
MFCSTPTTLSQVAGELVAQLASSEASSYLTILAVAGLVVAAANTVRLVMSTVRRYERRRAARIMQMRHPHCHVRRLADGHWLLIDKDTGKVYIPPRLAHPPIDEWI